MDPFFDDFISYEYQENPIQGGLFDTSYFLTSPFSDNSTHPSIFTNLLSESPYNLQSPPTIPNNTTNTQEAEVIEQQIQTPSTVTKNRQSTSRSPKEPLDLSKLYIPPALQGELGPKLNVQSKKIAKQAKVAEEPQETADQKKMSQMLKNRMSAQNSRDKKKVYVQQLEAENEFLKQEKMLMLDKIQRLESGYMQVLKENEMLKNSGSYICGQCGCTAGFENNHDSQVPIPGSESSVSDPIAQRVSSRGGVFGFAYTFTTVILLIFMMGSSEGEDKGSNNSINTLSPVINTHARSLGSLDTSIDFPVVEDFSLKPSPVENTVILEPPSFEKLYGGLSRNGGSVISQFESMVDNFDAEHETIYEAYERNDYSIMNLSQPLRNVTAISDSSDLSSNSSGKTFLSKPIVKARNKTSTLFCPTGFEFFKGTAEEEYPDNYTDFSFLSNVMGGYSHKPRPLNLEKAEYVQLLIPRNSISRLSLSGNSSEVDRSAGYNNSQGDSVVQVWCKIFAVKGLSKAM